MRLKHSTCRFKPAANVRNAGPRLVAVDDLRGGVSSLDRQQSFDSFLDTLSRW
jgi:hypothetical protein